MFYSKNAGIPLHEEYRLVEKHEADINGMWKMAHILVFFLAFIFGSLCTVFFHTLLYVFKERCALFQRVVSSVTVEPNLNLNKEFMMRDEEKRVINPPDKTQWIDKSTCYLPTYVPLVSAIFGLVWITMFFICSGGKKQTFGRMKRQWLMVFPVFVFSLIMGCICLYSSYVTHSGLSELCPKITEYSSPKTTVTQLARMAGVCQATHFTLLWAWLHSLCWLISALISLLRILLVVDFQLVKIKVEIKDNLDDFMDMHERQLRSVTPDKDRHDDAGPSIALNDSNSSNTDVYFTNKAFDATSDYGLHFDPMQRTSVKEFDKEKIRAEIQEALLWLNEANLSGDRSHTMRLQHVQSTLKLSVEQLNTRLFDDDDKSDDEKSDSGVPSLKASGDQSVTGIVPLKSYSNQSASISPPKEDDTTYIADKHIGPSNLIKKSTSQPIIHYPTEGEVKKVKLNEIDSPETTKKVVFGDIAVQTEKLVSLLSSPRPECVKHKIQIEIPMTHSGKIQNLATPQQTVSDETISKVQLIPPRYEAARDSRILTNIIHSEILQSCAVHSEESVNLIDYVIDTSVSEFNLEINVNAPEPEHVESSKDGTPSDKTLIREGEDETEEATKKNKKEKQD